MRIYKKDKINKIKVGDSIKEFGKKFIEEVKMVFDLIVNHPLETVLACSLAAGSMFASPNEADHTAFFRKIGVRLGLVSYTTEVNSIAVAYNEPFPDLNSSTCVFYLKNPEIDLFSIYVASEGEGGIVNVGFSATAVSNNNSTNISAQTGIDIKITDNIATGLTYNIGEFKSIIAGFRVSALNKNITVYGNSKTSNWQPMAGISVDLWGKAKIQAATNTVNTVFLDASRNFDTKIGVITPEVKVVLEKDKEVKINPSITVCF